ARLHEPRRRQLPEDLEHREVDATVLGDEEPAVGRERSTVGAAAGVGDRLAPTRLEPHALEGAVAHAGADERALRVAHARRAPHRALTELRSLADDVWSVHARIFAQAPSPALVTPRYLGRRGQSTTPDPGARA